MTAIWKNVYNGGIWEKLKKLKVCNDTTHTIIKSKSVNAKTNKYSVAVVEFNTENANLKLMIMYESLSTNICFQRVVNHIGPQKFSN